jgi:DNA-binding winged helix-turn-helix (wHTH) protein/tetratricopeptide (TPR) repeat protein
MLAFRPCERDDDDLTICRCIAEDRGRVNEAVAIPAEGFLTTAELAARPDFRLGSAVVSPSRRAITSKSSSADVEPRVMQVLLVLADAAGQVVTRDTLFRRCWGTAFAGDDSLNRAIGAVRRLASEIGGGEFEVETIPRTGYRLTGAVPSAVDGAAGKGQASPISRRGLLGASIAAGAVLIGGGLWWRARDSGDGRFDQIMARVQESIDRMSFDPQSEQLAAEAVAIRPDSASAWGMLALLRSMRAQDAPRSSMRADNTNSAADGSPSLEQAEQAIEKALALNSAQPNARLALFELKGSTLDWIDRDRTLRQIIAADHRNVLALTELLTLLQAAGLNRESWDLSERALTIAPLAPGLLARKAMKLWIAGRISAADKVIDQVRDLYPANPFGWGVRFQILALTNRAAAAKAMLDADPARIGPPASAAMWRPSLTALDRPTPANVAVAREACLAAAQIAGELAINAVMILGALGEVDAGFAVAEGFLLSRGRVVRKGNNVPRPLTGDATWRINTQWLFTPPCKAMRADLRFLPLCGAVGLTEYWRLRGVRPDYQRAARP